MKKNVGWEVFAVAAVSLLAQMGFQVPPMPTRSNAVS